MTELQLVAYTELHAALVKYGKHDWCPGGDPTRPEVVMACRALFNGKCGCGLAETIELLNPETVGIK